MKVYVIEIIFLSFRKKTKGENDIINKFDKKKPWSINRRDRFNIKIEREI